MRKTVTTSAVLLAFVVAGCGSGNAQSHRAAVTACRDNGNIGLSACECAVKNAETQGYSDQRVMSEMRDGTVISDQKLITIGLYCAGR
jgi:hypothetical protein